MLQTLIYRTTFYFRSRIFAWTSFERTSLRTSSVSILFYLNVFVLRNTSLCLHRKCSNNFCKIMCKSSQIVNFLIALMNEHINKMITYGQQYFVPFVPHIVLRIWAPRIVALHVDGHAIWSHMLSEQILQWNISGKIQRLEISQQAEVVLYLLEICPHPQSFHESIIQQ